VKTAMREILTNLYVGEQRDYETVVRMQPGWAVVHACKEPYHRQLLKYKTQGAPKKHPEYLFAEREDRLYLNLVDAPNPAYIPAEIIDKSLEFVAKKLGAGKKVLVHCNKGMSRAAVIGLLFLAQSGVYTGLDFEIAERKFMSIYPQYNPASGVRGYARLSWNKYCK